MRPAPAGFAARVVRWQKSFGRSGLPWQGSGDPYRVWLSEIMLQQTQVATVLDYYPRFIHRFPNVQALAAGQQDDVLALWSGLGYYSRARNLLRCAQAIVNQHGGEFPRSAEQLAMLPGIGRSTAAAIAAFCFGERVAILDANVRRVLARVLGIDADLSRVANQRQLWSEAATMLPGRDLARNLPVYTQGMMDLGALVCTPRRPRCLDCPVRGLCDAHAQGRPEAFPVKTGKLRRSAVTLWLMHATRPDEAVWLCRRPALPQPPPPRSSTQTRGCCRYRRRRRWWAA